MKGGGRFKRPPHKTFNNTQSIMLYKKLLTERAAYAPVKFKIYKSSSLTLSGYYIDMRVYIFKRPPQIIWTDEITEGREIIERKAITNTILEKMCFSLTIQLNNKSIILARYDKGHGMAYSTTQDYIRFLFPVPDTDDCLAGIKAIQNGLTNRCCIKYTIYFEDPAFVKRNGKVKGFKLAGKTVLTYRIIKITDIVNINLETTSKAFRYEALRDFCIKRVPIWKLNIYGKSHFDNVMRNGMTLLVPLANKNVIIAFAYLHDVERSNDANDRLHGEKAALLVDAIKNIYLSEFTEDEISLLKEACKLHGRTHKTGNITLDICLDADRLDLPRMGIIPTPEQMATEKGAELVVNMKNYYRFNQSTSKLPIK